MGSWRGSRGKSACVGERRGSLGCSGGEGMVEDVTGQRRTGQSGTGGDCQRSWNVGRTEVDGGERDGAGWKGDEGTRSEF